MQVAPLARPIRVLVAKIGLDGHDRGVKLIVRNLRDAGMEVIYTGLWQTPATTVQSAIQEDVDVLGVSLLSAAHMTIMPELRRLCNEAGVPDMPLIVGGIIPEEDHAPLRAAGVNGVFNPGTPMQSIIDTVRQLAESRRKWRDQVETHPDIRTAPGLARAITLLAAGSPPAEPATSRPAAAGIRIGITGAPGVGKSTFIGKLARHLRERGHRVGVIAVDPTSPITGGSVLGDRLRMMPEQPDDNLFVRSVASSGTAGGLAPHVAEISDLLVAAGYPVVLLETVGAGQNDVEVRRLTDQVLLLQMPGAGDAIQFFKAGIFEIATGFVLNKADLPGADTTLRQLRESVEHNEPVWPVSALRDEGFEPICTWVEELLAARK
ncbi:MAG: cobalamin-dependent protein [Phycisphaerales bacterium]|nr:cobalamin-dependent protein [Phycisphaerales bacterium]